MGLLDDVLKSALGSESSASPDRASSLVKSLLDMLGDPSTGGVSGLARTFQEHGLGEVVSSWIGTGPNRSIAPDQLSKALGSERVERIAKETGLPASQAAGLLAAVLPALVDQLTPDGHVPAQATLGERGKGILETIKSVFAGRAASAGPAPRPKADFSAVEAGASSTAPAPKGAEEEVYVVVAGDSLSKIAKHFYGNANQWRRIYDANKEVIGANPDLIRPGQKLRIPKG